MQTTVFDSNSYRYLVRDKTYAQYAAEIETIKAREKVMNIQPRVSIVVLSELLKHLVDPADPHYEECKNAVAAAILHCSEVVDGRRSVKSVPGLDYAIYSKLVGTPPNKDYEQSILSVAVSITGNFTDQHILSLNVPLSVNLQNELANRDGFYKGLLLSMKIMDPASTGFPDFLSDRNKRDQYFRDIRHPNFVKVAVLAKLSRLKSQYGEDIELTEELIDRYGKIFASAVELERKFWEKVADPRIGIQDATHKEINTFYDLMILIGSLVAHPDMIFVTRENQIVDSFARSGVPGQILTLPDYFTHIGVTGVPLHRYVV